MWGARGEETRFGTKTCAAPVFLQFLRVEQFIELPAVILTNESPGQQKSRGAGVVFEAHVYRSYGCGAVYLFYL